MRALPGGLRVIGMFHHGPPGTGAEFEKKVTAASVGSKYAALLSRYRMGMTADAGMVVLGLCSASKK